VDIRVAWHPRAALRQFRLRLLQIAVEIATREGSTLLVVEVEEADGSSESLARASAFLDSRGYEFEPVAKEQRPIVVLRASKQLAGDADV
jgi:hypothetical protein